MRVMTRTVYGPPDVVEVQDIERPVPKDNEMLIRIRAASVNPLDWHVIRGSPFIYRLSAGIGRPKNSKLGADLAGTVEAVGKDVTLFKPGDDVFGEMGGLGMGAFADYVCVPEQAAFARKPGNLSFQEAAAIPVAAITALQSVRDKGAVRSGQKVLINGSSGGVGTFAVQIAKLIGAEVTTVCSARNADLVRSIGADHVIDYAAEDFTESEERYDVIVDNVGNYSLGALKKALVPGGTCVIVGFSSLGLLLSHLIGGSLAPKAGKKRAGLMGMANSNVPDIKQLATWLESGTIKVVIDRRYDLTEVPEAIRYLETGRARGKVVIDVSA